MEDPLEIKQFLGQCSKMLPFNCNLILSVQSILKICIIFLIGRRPLIHTAIIVKSSHFNQNWKKITHFCLNMGPRDHIGFNEFKKN